MTETTPTLAQQLDTALASLRAKRNVSTWHDLAESLAIDPPYGTYETSDGYELRQLWAEFPVQTPFGEAFATLFRVDDTDDYGRSFDLRIPRGGSFKINGREYAPGKGGFLEYVSLTVEWVTSWDKRSLWQVRAGGLHEITPAAARKVSEWIGTEGAALIFAPERVAARKIHDNAMDAARKLTQRGELAAKYRDADAAANKAADANRAALADAVQMLAGE